MKLLKSNPDFVAVAVILAVLGAGWAVIRPVRQLHISIQRALNHDGHPPAAHRALHFE